MSSHILFLGKNSIPRGPKKQCSMACSSTKVESALLPLPLPKCVGSNPYCTSEGAIS